MSRIRSVHPGQWTDEDFVCLSFPARVLCIAIRNECDDQGVFEWKPMKIKMRLFPADNIDVEPLLAELLANEQCVRFEEGGRSYGAVRNFVKYQRPKKPNSVHPLPAEFRTYVGYGAPAPEQDADDGGYSSEPVPHQFPTSSEIAPQRKEEGGSKEEDIPSSKKSAPVGFDDFWAAYPRKVGKGDARAAYAEAVNKAAPDVILSAVRSQKFNPDIQFVPHPATWLGGERWEDGSPGPVEARASPADSALSAIKSGKRFLCTHITPSTARGLIEAGRVTEAECRDVGVL